MPHPPSPAERIEGATVMDGLAALEARGYAGQFVARAGPAVECVTCGVASPAPEVALRHLVRLEGASDPSGEAVVAGLECPRCAAKGTMVLTFGPAGSPLDNEIFAQVRDERGTGLPAAPPA